MVFGSQSDGLRPDDDNTVRNVYRKDRITGAVALVSIASDRTPADGRSYRAR